MIDIYGNPIRCRSWRVEETFVLYHLEIIERKVRVVCSNPDIQQSTKSMHGPPQNFKAHRFNEGIEVHEVTEKFFNLYKWIFFQHQHCVGYMMRIIN